MLTNLGIANSAARCLGRETWADLEDFLKGDLLDEFNGALQELAILSPAFLRQKEMSDIIHGPRNISGLTVTQYSKTIANGGITSDMLGCTLRFSNQQADTQLTGTTSLLDAYMDSSSVGGGSGIVFGDCVTLPANVIAVDDPVYIPDIRQLKVASNRADALQILKIGQYSNYGLIGVTSSALDKRIVYQPFCYWVETEQADSTSPTAQLVTRLRVYPLPDVTYNLRYNAQISYGNLVIGDIVDGKAIPLPLQYHESILLPWVKFRLSTSPHFNKELMSSVSASKATALAMLDKFKPKAAGGRRMVRLPGH